MDERNSLKRKLNLYIQSCSLPEHIEFNLFNSKMFFDGVFLSIYSHLLKKLEHSKFCRKKVMGL